jgi:hypothetical protein
VGHRILVSLITAVALGTGIAATADARVHAESNVLEIIVGNGPFTGTYKPPASEIICMHATKQKVYAASYKNFAVKGAKALAEGGVSVSNPDVPGAKVGDVLVTFGDAAKKPTVYAVNGAPLTITRRGAGADIAFVGKTKDGIELRVTAKCVDVEKL